MEYLCKLCNTLNISDAEFSREGSLCSNCNSNSRLRYAALIVEHLLKDKASEKIGLGLSENPYLASYLKSKTIYVNSYYHLDKDDELYFDILNPNEKQLAAYDYVTSLDVFEHTPPPAINAFIGAFNVLRPGGYLVFSVPYTFETETVEHFPNLYDFKIEKLEQRDQFVLKNTTRYGDKEEFKNLIFHGGPGQTLEMRVFCKNDLLNLLKDSGFTEIKIWEENYPEVGAAFPEKWSRLISARKPINHDS